MTFEFKTITTLSKPAHIAALRKQYCTRDLDRVYRDCLTCLLFETCDTGMTAGEILHPPLWQKWTPQRRLAMGKLLARMVAFKMLPWRLVGKNRRGQNVYVAIRPLPKIHRMNID